MPRWGSDQKKALGKLFESDNADPQATDAKVIDPVYALAKEFEAVTLPRFRDNYKKCAAEWMAGKALEGKRRSQLGEEDPPPANTNTMTTTTLPTKSATSYEVAAKSAFVPVEFADDEVEWVPIYTAHVYPAKNYDRFRLVMEPPSNYNGNAGSFKTNLEKQGMQFMFKVPPNEVLHDPHHIHLFQTSEYGREFSGDSAAVNSMKKAVKRTKGKWPTFRIPTPFKCEKSNDLSVPWIDFTVINNNNKDHPVIIIELKSVAPIEEEEHNNEITHQLTAKKFKSPDKTNKKRTADEALIQRLKNSGLSADEIERVKEGLSSNNSGSDDMTEDGGCDEYMYGDGSAKRKKTSS